MVIYGDLWWFYIGFMVIYGDLWWFMVIYDGMVIQGFVFSFFFDFMVIFIGIWLGDNWADTAFGIYVAGKIIELNGVMGSALPRDWLAEGCVTGICMLKIKITRSSI